MQDKTAIGTYRWPNRFVIVFVIGSGIFVLLSATFRNRKAIDGFAGWGNDSSHRHPPFGNIDKMTATASLGTRYLSWRKEPPATARYISGKVQTTTIGLWSLVTLSTGIMGHLDFDLAQLIGLHIKQTLFFLGPAALVALLVPTRSITRFMLQTWAIAFFGTLGFLATATFATP